MQKFIFVFLFILFNTFVGYGQKETEQPVKVELRFFSPRNTRIINLLLDDPNISDFCNNFYNFYYTETTTFNKYYIVDKNVVRDSIVRYDAHKSDAIYLRGILLNDEKYEKVFIVPLH